MPSHSPISVVIPAYNEEACIDEVVREVSEVLQAVGHEILVVDDGSTDQTALRAQEAGARVLSRASNRGYGAALKMGIRHAKNDWVAIMDSDGQHKAQDLFRLIEKSRAGHDMVIGARDKTSFQYTSRLPGKYFLQWVAGYLVGERPDDVNSGLRLFRRADALRYMPLLPNGFSLTTTLTLAMLKDGCDVASIPIQVEARRGRVSSVTLKDGLGTFLLIMRIAMLFNPLKVFLPMSVLLFAIGAGYAVYNVAFREFNIPDGAVLLMVASIIVFFFGILADQLASIRRGG